MRIREQFGAFIRMVLYKVLEFSYSTCVPYSSPTPGSTPNRAHF